MHRIFLGNFNFEHELARAAGATAPPKPDSAAGARLAAGSLIDPDRFWIWLSIADADDLLLAPPDVNEADFPDLVALGLPLPRFVPDLPSRHSHPALELVPWGWTDSVIALGKSHGWSCLAPPLEVVRDVNSRGFRFAQERKFDVAVAGTAMISAIDDLESILRQHANTPRGWLLKASFGMSGREALRGWGTILNDQTRNWAQKRLATVGPIIVEPIVDRIGEAGVQIDIPQTDPPTLAGVTPLLVDGSGVYRGSRFGCSASELEIWQPAVEMGMRVARTVQRLGYYGPLGIDAMLYRDETGEIRLRPLQDLNARHTMGRLALGFGRTLPAGWCGAWLHFNRRHLASRDVGSWLNQIRCSLPAATIVALTSPRTIGSQPVEHHAVLVLASSPEMRRLAEAALFKGLAITIEEGSG
jgi:hypothetical protein